jgi:hypothetical protein
MEGGMILLLALEDQYLEEQIQGMLKLEPR